MKGSDNVAWASVPEYDTLAAGTYTVSGNNVEIRDASKNTVIATCIGDTFSKFTLNEDTAIKIKVGCGLDKYPTIVKAMLNKGDSKKPYEPYTGGKPSPSIEYPQEITNCGEDGTINLEITGDNAEPQTLTIPTPNGLLGLKVDVNGNYTDETGQQWITDEIDLARGKYVQRIGKHACTGNENIFKSFEDESIIEYMFHAEGISSNVLYESNGLSTHYEYLNACKGGTCTIGAGKYAYIRYNVADNVTPAQIQEFYRRQKETGTPVTFYYVLAEPVEYDLPPETIAAFKQLHTNHPNTIVSNNADAGMELTYTVDTQSYIDGKIATLSKAML